jgi:hypothetical protein
MAFAWARSHLLSGIAHGYQPQATDADSLSPQRGPHYFFSYRMLFDLLRRGQPARAQHGRLP